MLPSALHAWPDIESRLKRARFAVFVDYDGTLTPIAAKPELATLDDAQRDRLRRLAERHPTAVVTGRGMADVRRLVGLPGLHYAADHGFEISGPNVAFEVDPRLRPTFERVAAELASRVGDVPGIVLEKKGYSVAVHFRLSPEDRVAQLEQAIDTVIASSNGLRKGVGKKVFEIRPTVQWHKGAAVGWLLEQWDATLPIVIGDDRTDEDAFETAQERDGIAIVVGKPAWTTAAKLSVEDPDEVGRLLESIYKV